MKKFLLLILALFTTTVVVSSVNGDSMVGSLPSLNWQRQNLESSIRSTLHETLAPIIKSSEYIISVDIQTTLPETPDFYTSDVDRQIDESADSQLSEAEKKAKDEGITVEEAKEKMAEQAKLEDEKKDEAESRGSIRFTDEVPDENSDGYIVMSKFGVIAPLVDDFNDFKPDGKIILTMDSGNESADRKADEMEMDRLRSQFKEREDKFKKQLESMKNATREPSLIEQTWKYNQTVDIFSNLRSVKISVLLNEDLAQVTRDSVERALNGISFSLGSVKPSVEIDYIPMNETKSGGSIFTSLLNFLEKFSTAIAMIIATLIIALTALFLLKQHQNSKKQAESNQMNMSGRLDSRSENESENESDGGGVGGGDPGAGLDFEKGLSGIERFQSFFEKSQVDAVMLVKRWIQSGNKEDNDALRGLVQQLENGILVELFKKITEEERGKWKSLLSSSLSPEILSKANRHISNQVVEQIILPNPIVDSEVCDLLLKLSPEQGANLVRSSLSDGAILMNVMSTKFVNQIMEQLTADITSDLIEKSLEFSMGDLESKMSGFKKSLLAVLDSRTAVPFLNKVKELIVNVNPSREGLLYAALGNSGERNFILQLATKKIPADLVFRLPTNCLKSIFSKYPISDRVEILLSLDETLREEILSAVAPEGSKNRDVLNIEFESAVNNFVLQKKLKTAKNQIFDNFVIHTRNFLSSDRSYDQEISESIDNWCSEICHEHSRSDNLSSIAS